LSAGSAGVVLFSDYAPDDNVAVVPHARMGDDRSLGAEMVALAGVAAARF